MPSEFHCPLLEDDCITVKHIVQEEKINAREVRLRRSIYNDLSDLDAAYANLDPQTYYESTNLYPEENFIYQNITSVEQSTTRPDGYCRFKHTNSSYVRRRTVKTFYDFDITVEAYDYHGGTTVELEHPYYYTDWFPSNRRHTFRISGRVLKIERWREYDNRYNPDTGYFDIKDYSLHISDYLRFYHIPHENGTCDYDLVAIYNTKPHAPEYVVLDFVAKDIDITWHSPIIPHEDTYNFYSENTLVASHTIREDDYLYYSQALNQPKQETVYKFKKADYLPNAILKQLEVTDFAYNFLIGYVDPLNPQIEIPRHCWNIYMSVYPPNIAGVITTDDVEFIMQICTDDPGTFERPTLEISCGCGESCPNGTCPVECTDHVCCYSSEGFPVKEIPLSNYDG